jgi:NADPH:quinone reductase-like Zn-dependent oxidoreductase
VRVGDRVVGDINVTCGQCEQCLNGRPTHCEQRTVLGIVKRHGTFAEYTTLPVANLHRVPDSVPDEMAVFTEPLAAALEIQGNQAAVVNCRFVKPLDRELVLRVAGDTGRLITVEENVLQGGFGSAVLELVADEGLSHVQVVRLGIGHRFVEHASQTVQRSLCGVDASAIIQAARAMVPGNDLEKAASR